jgi:hypothetical protein
MKLTEVEAWEFVREAFRDKNLVQRFAGDVGAKCLEGEPGHGLLGMCDVLYDLYKAERISGKTFEEMLEKIKWTVVHELKTEYGFAWSKFLYPNTRYGARKRREFCTKMIRDLPDQE